MFGLVGQCLLTRRVIFSMSFDHDLRVLDALSAGTGSNLDEMYFLASLAIILSSLLVDL
jgi:hypothetical protein